MTNIEDTIVLTHAQVKLAAARDELALGPADMLQFKLVANVAGERIYEGPEDGMAILDGAFGVLVVLEDGAKLIKGSPTFDAAKSAASIAVRMGL